MKSKIFKTILFCSFVFCTLATSAQKIAQKVGDNPGMINSSAMLDVESTTKGFLPPRMTVANRDAIVLPASGLIIYNITSNVLQINTGTPGAPVWSLASSGNLTGDVTSSGAVTTVGKINGVTMSGLATGLLKNTTATGVPSVAAIRTDYGEPTTALATGILKNTTGTGEHSIAVAADFPILNQNTTGNAATVTTNANLTGMVTSVGNVATVVTNANLTGEATSVGNAVTLGNAAVIEKVLTGYTSGAGTISAADNVLQAIQKLDGNDAIPGKVFVYTSGAFYSPSTGVKWIIVECLGGGGAGGTAPVTASTTCAASGGGGGGGYRKVILTKAQLTATSYSIVIGAGGPANASVGVGGAGGDSSFGAISLVRALGGAGGVQSAATTNAIVALGGAGGASASSAGSLVYALNGRDGEAGYSTTNSTTRFFKGGNGGDSFLGFGGINNIAIATTVTASVFINPTYGGGGAGVSMTGAQVVRVGQPGAPGLVVVTEFF